MSTGNSILAVAKMVANGVNTGLDKAYFHRQCEARADEIRKANESKEQAFARAITEDEEGRLLFKAAQRSKGSDVPPRDAPQDYVAPPKPEELGPAHAKLHSLAVDHQRAHPRLSYESAYSQIYTHPSNAKLRDAARNEHLKASLARVG
jgi:hypothetical protein